MFQFAGVENMLQHYVDLCCVESSLQCVIILFKSTQTTSFFLGTIFLCVEKLKEQLSQAN